MHVAIADNRMIHQSGFLNEQEPDFVQWCFASDGGALYVLKCTWKFKSVPSLQLAGDRTHYYPNVDVYRRAKEPNHELGRVDLKSNALGALVYLFMYADSTTCEVENLTTQQQKSSTPSLTVNKH